MKLEKQHIIDVSIDLFAENGVKDVSLERIAKEMCATRGKIYYYFKKGKPDIIEAILQKFEDYVMQSIPNPNEWKTKESDAGYILSKLFFKFEESEAVRYRKIIRIILSEMYFDEQIKQYASEYLIIGREKILADCFASLADNGLIAPLADAESAARFLNRLIVVYAISDALSYPYKQIVDDELFQTMGKDCMNFITYLLARKQSGLNCGLA